MPKNTHLDRMIILSIVVCTYNRADMLATVLENLAGQTLSPDEFEILIVDNNSTDDTARIAQEFCAKYPHFRYCLEKKIGLSHARNRGLAEAKGIYVGYTDDDCRIPADWLEKAHRIATEHAPVIFGGPWLPFYTVPKPYWYLDKYDMYAQGNYPKHPESNSNFHPSGANVFYQREILNMFYGFDITLGMKGVELGYEEETAIQRTILESVPSASVFFDPELFVYHWVRPQKMNVVWKFRQQYALGRSKVKAQSSKKNISFLGYLKLTRTGLRVFLILLSSPIIALFRDRTALPFVQNYYYEIISRQFFYLGKALEYYTKQ